MSSKRPYPLTADDLKHLSANDLLQQKPTQLYSVTPNETVYRAVELMAEVGVGALPVLQAGCLVGIVSERDYARRVILLGRRSQDTRVDAIMTKTVVTVSRKDSLRDCIQRMTEHQIRHLPVVEGLAVVGIITIGDVLRAVMQQQSQTIDELNRYVSGEPRLQVT